MASSTQGGFQTVSRCLPPIHQTAIMRPGPQGRQSWRAASGTPLPPTPEAGTTKGGQEQCGRQTCPTPSALSGTLTGVVAEPQPATKPGTLPHPPRPRGSGHQPRHPATTWSRLLDLAAVCPPSLSVASVLAECLRSIRFPAQNTSRQSWHRRCTAS